MITPPERSAARDAALESLLPHVAALGWNLPALQRAANADADMLFPGGTADLVEAFLDWLDRRMAETAAPLMANQRLTQRVRTLLASRIALTQARKPALRAVTRYLARPPHGLLAARCTARSVDAIWDAAGDTSADFSWYTKRAILTVVLTTTMVFWMADSTTEEAALAFLDRRLDGVGRLMKLRARLTGGAAPKAQAA